MAFVMPSNPRVGQDLQGDQLLSKAQTIHKEESEIMKVSRVQGKSRVVEVVFLKAFKRWTWERYLQFRIIVGHFALYATVTFSLDRELQSIPAPR